MKHTYTKRDFHNPEQLTRQQVGAEFRLLLPDEVDGRFSYKKKAGGQTRSMTSCEWLDHLCDTKRWSYRVPLATPLPDGAILSSNECCFSDEPQKFKVYCAGPMSGVENYNFDTFYQACDFLEKQGYEAINPAALDAESGYTLVRLKQLTPTEFQEFLKGAMKRDLEAIQSCDALVLLPGWESSKGARAEKAVAEWGGKRVGYLWSERGDGFRLTWEDEAGESGVAGETGPVDTGYSDNVKQPDTDGWIPHVPGDPMPCDGDMLVDYKMRVKQADLPFTARYIDWGICGGLSDPQVIAWRPHQPKQPLPYNSDERAEWDVEFQDGFLEATGAEQPHSPGNATYVDRDSRGNITSSGYAANDPKGAAGALKAPMQLLPPDALVEISKVMGEGARKYQPWNFIEANVCTSTYIGAILRHWAEFAKGRDMDDGVGGSGLSHLSHIAANCMILLTAKQQGTLIDDRPKLK